MFQLLLTLISAFWLISNFAGVLLLLWRAVRLVTALAKMRDAHSKAEKTQEKERDGGSLVSGSLGEKKRERGYLSLSLNFYSLNRFLLFITYFCSFRNDFGLDILLKDSDSEASEPNFFRGEAGVAA